MKAIDLKHYTAEERASSWKIQVLQKQVDQLLHKAEINQKQGIHLRKELDRYLNELETLLESI